MSCKVTTDYIWLSSGPLAQFANNVILFKWWFLSHVKWVLKETFWAIWVIYIFYISKVFWNIQIKCINYTHIFNALSVSTLDMCLQQLIRKTNICIFFIAVKALITSDQMDFSVFMSLTSRRKCAFLIPEFLVIKNL